MNDPTPSPSDELIRLAEVETAVGLKRSQIYEDIKNNAFPRPAKLGAASRWSRREINAWIAGRLRARSAA